MKKYDTEQKETFNMNTTLREESFEGEYLGDTRHF